MSEEEVPTGPPEDAPTTGIFARWMNESDMNKYHLKEPEAKLWETVDFAEFEIPFILDDIKTGGALYSIFHCVKDAMAAYPEDEVVRVHADENKLWGENFVICTTVEARDYFRTSGPVGPVSEADTAAAEAAEAAAAEEARLAEAALEQERLEKLVYVEVPLVPQPYDSDSLIDTEIAMEQLTGKMADARPKIVVRAIRPRRDFGSPLDLHAQDAEILSHASADFRKHQMAPRMFALRRAELEMGIQVGPGVGLAGGRETRACQTPWFRQVNKGIQYAHRTASAVERSAELEKPELAAFLDRVFPRIDLALSQNSIVDVYATGLRLTPMEAALSLSNPSDTTAKELRFFSHLKYSKEKALVCVDWHPTRSGVVAVSCLPHQTFEERVPSLAKASKSYVLVWNSVEQMLPESVLESPFEVLSFQYNPVDPTYIAGGTASGQVVIWDLDEPRRTAREQKKQAALSDEAGVAGVEGGSDSSASGDSAASSAETPSTLVPIAPSFISSIDLSHERPIAKVQWLPKGKELSQHGGLVNSIGAAASECNQFLTVSGDGTIAMWDIRIESDQVQNAFKRKLITMRRTVTPGARNASRRRKSDTVGGVAEHTVWGPSIVVRVQRPSTSLGGQGQKVGLCGIELSGVHPDTRFYVTTEEGDLLYAMWSHDAEGNAGGKGSDESALASLAPLAASHTAGASVQVGVPIDASVLWVAADHFRPALSLQRSKFMPNCLLSVGKSSFNLWYDGLAKPIFSSAISPVAFSGGTWSPTRPGVILIAKSDGGIDVWEFTEQTNKPTQTLSVASVGINSIAFERPSNHFSPDASSAAGETEGDESGSGGAAAGGESGSGEAQQQENLLLAVGDAGGNLHIVELPRHLWGMHPHEYSTARDYIEHEAKRLSYVQRRDTATKRAVKSQSSTSAQAAGGSAAPALANAAFATDQEQHYRHIERKLTRLLKKVEITDVDAKVLVDALKS